jgi:deoxyribodipyrimidine photo-lyase
MTKEFPTDLKSILERIDAIDPIAYGKTRNFIDGAVSYLSPYISRGVISTQQIMRSVLERGYGPNQIEKFLQELAWRDYWQQTWKAVGTAINRDLRHEQTGVVHRQMPSAILSGTTGIEAIDLAIQDLYETGYMHNHLRMYTASMACNLAGSHWNLPARWMYYHLLDGDWASNALSWQWVAGTNSSKKYYANQENVNKYCYTNQTGSFLDIPYSDFDHWAIPDELSQIESPKFHTSLPEVSPLQVDAQKPTLIYNYYNLDPKWQENLDANRILLLEPSFFEQFPISPKCMDFALGLAKNIQSLQVFVGEFEDLKNALGHSSIHFKEHPTNEHYEGIEDSRDWMFSVEGHYPSFFAFWKKGKKELK